MSSVLDYLYKNPTLTTSLFGIWPPGSGPLRGVSIGYWYSDYNPDNQKSQKEQNVLRKSD